MPEFLTLAFHTSLVIPVRCHAELVSACTDKQALTDKWMLKQVQHDKKTLQGAKNISHTEIEEAIAAPERYDLDETCAEVFDLINKMAYS